MGEEAIIIPMIVIGLPWLLGSIISFLVIVTLGSLARN